MQFYYKQLMVFTRMLLKPICYVLGIHLVIGALAFAHANNNEDQPGLVPSDYFDFTFLKDVQVSPDGSATLFVKTNTNKDASGRNSSIYIIQNNEPPRVFTSGDADSSPRWSADSKQIAFLRTVKGNDGKMPQVFVMSKSGGEAQQMTDVEDYLLGFQWIPNSQRLLLHLESVDTSNNESLDEKGEQEREKPSITVVKNAKYQANGLGLLSDKRAQLFVYDMNDKSLDKLIGSEAWNIRNPNISSDGKHVYFHANMTGDEYEGGVNSDIYSVDLASNTLLQLTKHPHSQYSPSASPSTNKVAYLHNEAPFAQSDLWVMNKNGEKAINVSAEFDREASSVVWGSQGKYLYFTAADHGATRLFQADISNLKIEAITPNDQSVGDFSISGDGKFAAMVIHNSVSLPEIYRLDLKANRLSKQSRFNDDLLATKKLSVAQEFWFENDKGMRVQGFYHTPIDFDENKQYPLVLNIKGGPGGMWGHGWFHENQMYAALGYAVAYVNYRGSDGYGEAHSLAVRLDYGGADYEDNIQFLDKIIEQNAWIDPDNLYITGGSHGGFLSNWITTKTNRFKAAVTQRSVSSWISEAGTQEFTPSSMSLEFGGNLWENFDYYWGRSPLKFADQVTTPTLIIHSDNDRITPLGQGQEWFYALKANDVPVEMVIFKGETHSLSRSGKPTNLVERLDRIIAWFEKYRHEAGEK